MSKKTVIFILAVFLVVTNITYFYALSIGSNNQVFGGFIQNPIDGNSYLAKMYEGFNGSWRFQLPYSNEKQSGAFLFLFYLFLGHVSRWLSVSLITVFHAARIFCSAILCLSMIYFAQSPLGLSNKKVIYASLFALFGAGLGWTVVLLGVYTSDFWVAETYPFLSACTNPHFPLGLSLLLVLLRRSLAVNYWKDLLIPSVVGILLAIVYPFGIVVAAVIIGGCVGWQVIQDRKIEIKPALGLVAGGLFLVYQFLVITLDPVLSGWNEQNITTAPPLWDLLLSLSPVLFLAITGLSTARRTLDTAGFRLLVCWAGLGILLVYLPFNLQRRFMFGLFIPLSILSIFGLEAIAETIKKPTAKIFPAFFVLSTLTNLLVLVVGISGLREGNPILFYTSGEYQALRWIEENTSQDSLILASPDFGLYIPAQTGRKVLYGHPFETIQAETKKQSILAFYKNEMDVQKSGDFIKSQKIDLIFYGPREQALGNPKILQSYQPLFIDQSVSVYDTK